MKLFKLLSPISIVILAIAMFAVFGNGCTELTDNQTTLPGEDGDFQKKQSSIPILDIIEPGLATTTRAESMIVKGETDQEKVYVANQAFDVINGEFAARVDLKPGLNITTIEAGNGFTTTTINLQIIKN
ncbi:hypothetical protein GF391_02180 [Candidatus Uhrbacteria bacterium]|nr:hypothetical protein [Candidatus Uhrbacteria bacterium]